MDILPIACFIILVAIMAVHFRSFMIAAQSLMMDNEELAAKLEALDNLMQYLSNTPEIKQADEETKEEAQKEDKEEKGKDIAYLRAYV